MYAEYFGLKEAPFSIAPNPNYLYMSPRHREALAHLLYGVGVGGGFVLLTGEVGTGKTTVCRCFLEQIPDEVDVAFVLNPLMNSQELLATVCDELSIEYTQEQATTKGLTEALYHFLLMNHARGRNTVLLIDEAQLLEFEVLEQIRLLTNLETNSRKLLQIIFIGQPELRELLRQPRLRQLSQRITARFHIEPLNQQETADYIRHRLQTAGQAGGIELFSDKLIARIHQFSGGVPRLINVVCDRMLLGAYAQNRTHLDGSLFESAISEIRDEQDLPGKSTWRWPLKHWQSGAIAAMLLFGILIWQWPLLAGLFSSNPSRGEEVVEAAPAQPPQQESGKRSPLNEVETSSLQEVSEAEQRDVVAAAEEIEIADTDRLLAVSYETREGAINQLLKMRGRYQLKFSDPCAEIGALSMRCERESVRNWSDFRSYGRPAVLSLDFDGRERYVALVGMSDHLAMLANKERRLEIPLISLGRWWTGDFQFIWHPPEGYRGNSLVAGERSPMVSWLADVFMELNDDLVLPSGEVYSSQLQQQVREFQRVEGLQQDGVVGLKTLLRLNVALGLDDPLREIGDGISDNTAALADIYQEDP